MKVDVLLRNPYFHSLSIIIADWKKMIMDEYTKDKFIARILSGMVKNRRYVIRDGIILKRNKVILVPKSEVQQNILHILHNAPLMGHLRVAKIYQAI